MNKDEEIKSLRAQVEAAADCADTLHAYELIATLRARQEELMKIAEEYSTAWDCYQVFPSLANEKMFAIAEAKLTAFKEGMK